MIQQSRGLSARPAFERPVKSEELTRYFDAVSSTYFDRYLEQSPGGYALRVRKQRVLELLNYPSGKVLDVGCGPGVMVSELLKLGWEVWGVDASPGMIQQCKKNFADSGRAHFLVADAAELPFAAEFFDLVICMGVIGSVQSSAPVLTEVSRVTAKNGTLLVSFPNLLSPYALWKIAIFYPLVALLRPLYYGLRGRSRPASLYNGTLWRKFQAPILLFAGLYTARFSSQQLYRLGSKVTEIIHFNFNIFLSPLDELFPRFCLRAAEKLERLRFGRLKWLGSGFIVKACKFS
jgi:SAM-dependent methyltransferase